MRINLHSHTNYSADGILTVKEILEKAEVEKMDVFSITDHNSLDAYLDPEYNKHYHGKLLIGTELCVMFGDKGVDITCYHFDFDMIYKYIKENYLTSVQTQQRMYQQLLSLCKENNIELTPHEPMPEGLYAHRYIYDLMLDNEFFDNYDINTGDDFFRVSVTNKEFPLYLNMASLWPKLEDAVNVIKAAGGLVFFAHPYDYTGLDVLSTLQSIKPYVDGIEVSNAKTDEEQVEFLYNFAKENNLLMSVGTDFHGTPGRNKFINEPSDKIIQELNKWIDKE